MNQTACALIGENCDYGAAQCTCNVNGWHCNTCPAAQPANGSVCGGMGFGGKTCDYGDTHCHCNGGFNSQWACIVCPAQQPAPGSSCNVPPNQACTYGANSCICVQGQYFCN
jgi:hypothetical protein